MKPINESARARALRLARLAALADRLAVAELARVDRELAAALKTGGPEKPAPDPLRVAGQSAAPATPPAPRPVPVHDPTPAFWCSPPVPG